MIKLENTQVFGWEAAIRGARNPMNSWEKSDTFWIDSEEGEYKTLEGNQGPFYHFNDTEMAKQYNVEDFVLSGLYIGPNDHKLLMNLCNGGTEEAKWRRMVHVQMDVTAPLYWWKEFETYKVGTVSNSCSTMHKIHAKEFTLEDFSCEHLVDCPDSGECEPHTVRYDCEGNDEYFYPMDSMRITVSMLNAARESYLKAKTDFELMSGRGQAYWMPKNTMKKYWWQMIQLLPSSYNQLRTIDLNYEVLAAQYQQRKDHKLDEWREYCEWIKSLPYSELITMEES